MPLPAPPAMRVAYHEDGSALVINILGYGVQTRTSSEAKLINGVTLASALPTVSYQNDAGPVHAIVVFPQIRNLRGVFISHTNWRGANATAASCTARIWTSVDTTTGVDGTWVDSGVNITSTYTATSQAIYRSNIQGVSVDNIKGVAVRYPSQFGVQASSPLTTYNQLNIHIYADVLSSTGSDRLQLWHPTLDQPILVSDFDAGDVQRGTITDKTFRLKNVSSTLTAQGSGVTVGISGDSSPSLLTQVLVSNDGTNFAATASAGNISAGALSGVLTVRYNISMSQPLGAWSPYILPTVTSWT